MGEAAPAIQAFALEDYEEAYDLWLKTPGVGLSDADAREAIARYLDRNPEVSSAARAGGRLIGTLLAGHDGRRGFLHHLAVAVEWRRRGVGLGLVQRSLCLLQQQGIARCHIVIYARNQEGQEFWRACGWSERVELRLFSRDIAGV